MRRILVVAVLLVLLAPLAPPALAEDSPHAFTADTLPPGWEIQQEILVPDAQLAGVSQRLGGKIASLSNQVVSVGGFRLRVNVITAADDPSAQALHAKMAEFRPEPFVRRSGRRIYEVAGDNVLAARRAFAALGVGEQELVLWDVGFRIALIDELDYTRANEVFNLFLKREQDPDGAPAADAAIRAITKDWTFGTTLRLEPATRAGQSWRLTPSPHASSPTGPSPREHTFSDPPALCGVSYVDVAGTVGTRPGFVPVLAADAGEASPADLASTRFWPVDDETVRARARKVTEGLEDDRSRLRALLAHVNESVRYGGAMGTRDGVLPVLARGYGRCWDQSDVLVTLCRAAGLPARQVAGWVPPIGAGHVWLEVHLEGEGWLPVDATCPWLGTSADYLPFFRTSDGHMPIVYLAMPRIERRAN